VSAPDVTHGPTVDGPYSPAATYGPTVDGSCTSAAVHPSRNGFAHALTATNMVFEEFVVPDPLVTGPLLGATLAVAALLYLTQPAVSQRVALAFVPWMVLGALLHVLYQMHVALGETLLPGGAVVLSAPAVYLTTFVLMSVVWLLAARGVAESGRGWPVPGVLASVGILAAVPVAGYAGLEAADQLTLDPLVPVAGLVGSLALTALLYLALDAWRPDAIAAVRYVGTLVLFAHVFDAITTTLGITLLDAGERSTLPRLLMDIAADLPTADLLADAWLFVAVKILLAVAVVVYFHDYVEERPTEGTLFFAAIAAVGLGPGAHNFFLFIFGV